MAPGRDDKVVVAWNAWAIAGLAEAGALLGRPEWTQSAVECRDALWAHNVVEGDVRRVSRDGVPGAALGVLEDYAALACAEFTLCAVTGEDLDRGLQLVTDLSGVFLDQDRDTAATDVPTAGIDMTDNATPSGWSLAAEALLTASALTGEMAGRSRAEQMLGRAAHLAGYPQFWGHGLAVLEALVDGPREVALLAGVGSPMHVTALAGTAPGAVVALSGPLCEGRSRIGGQDTAYVCRQFVCDAPTTDPEVLARQVR